MGAKGLKIKFRDIVGGDRPLWIIILGLCVFSVLVVYSSTGSLAYKNFDGDTNVYLISQLKYTCFGLLVAVAVHWISYKYYLKWGIWLFLLALGLMIATFFQSGVEYNEASRWLESYKGLTFQPADLLKIAVVIMLARALAIRQHTIDKIKILPSLWPPDYFSDKKAENIEILTKTTIPMLLPVVISIGLVIVSSLSTALIIAATCFTLLIMGRVRVVELFRLIFLAILVLSVAFLIMKATGVGRAKTWESRITAFVTGGSTPSVDSNMEMDAGEYQKHQALIAVASGWLAGKGPGNSTQRSNLPHPYSDYAYAFIIEEYGIIAAILLLGCYIWIFSRTIVIFRTCDRPYPSLLVLGLGLLVSVQAFLHMAVSVGIGPVTGQTLPIISKGGSSLVFTCFAFGIIQSVARIENKKMYLLRLEKERKLVVEEWNHVVVSENEIEKIGRGKKQPEKYNGVIWNREDKSDS